MLTVYLFLGQIGENVTIKVFITLAGDTFKLQRFAPKLNNVQYTWFFGTDDTSVLETLGQFYS